MMRLILVMAFIAVLVIAINAVLGTMQTVAQAVIGKDADIMPDTFRRVAFGALIILLIGLSTGWLGGI